MALYKKCVQKVLASPVLVSGIQLGKRVNLFEAMQTLNKPCDIATLASETHLKEQYLNELLHSYVSSGVMELNTDKEVLVPDWKLFKESFLDRELSYIPDFQKVAPTLEKCFSDTGPAGYSHDDAPFVMNYVRNLRKAYNIPIAKELGKLITTYTDKHKKILDLGCGTGDLTIPLATTLDSSTVHGCDISEGAIAVAKEGSSKIKNLAFSIEDIANLPEQWTGTYDVVLLFDVLHDLQQPLTAMKQVLSVLAQDGIVIIVDPKVSSDPRNNIGNIHAAQALTLSSWWCIPSSSCDHGSGHGVGWGWENKELFLLSLGLEIVSRVCLVKSDYNYAYVCKRK